MVVAASVTAGCIPIDPVPPCDGPPRVPAVFEVRGTTSFLEKVTLISEDVGNQSVSVQLSPCPTIESRQTLLAKNGSGTFPRMIDLQTYSELRYEFNDHLLRLDVTLERNLLQNWTRNHTIILDLEGAEPVLTWQNESAPDPTRGTINVERWERYNDTSALEPYLVRGEERTLQNETRNYTWHVESSWNRGVLVRYHLQRADGQPKQDPGVYRNATVTVDVVAPNGTVMASDTGPREGQPNSLYHHPDAAGEWTVTVTANTGERPPGGIEYELDITFRY